MSLLPIISKLSSTDAMRSVTGQSYAHTISLSFFLSFSFSLVLSLFLSLYIYIYLYLSLYIYICLYLYIYTSISIYLSIYLSTSISIYLSIYIYIHLSLSISTSLRHHLSILHLSQGYTQAYWFTTSQDACVSQFGYMARFLIWMDGLILMVLLCSDCLFLQFFLVALNFNWFCEPVDYSNTPIALRVCGKHAVLIHLLVEFINYLLEVHGIAGIGRQYICTYKGECVYI